MRALFILYGAPGSGKTTLVHDLGVEDLTIGFDQFRKLFCPTVPCYEKHEAKAGRTLRIRSDDEAHIIKATMNALDSRMAAGSTVFFDATSLHVKDQKNLMKKAARYGYACHLIDVQGNQPLDLLLRRNEYRGEARLDQTILTTMWELGAQKNIDPNLPVISGNTDDIEAAIADITATPVVTSDRFVVVGDVHSCSQPLHEAVVQQDTPDTHWVFVGDLFDRGPDPVGVWNIVQNLLSQQRATVVTGNHELNLRAINNHTTTQRHTDTRETRDAFISEGIYAAEQTAFVNATVPAVFLYPNKQGTAPVPRLVTHGGVGRLTSMNLRHDLLHVTDAECIYGLGYRNKTYRAKSSYDFEKIALDGRQFHGHRNGEIGGTPIDAVRDQGTGEVICLESGVASGKTMSIAVYNANSDSTEIIQYADGVDPARAAHFSMSPESRRHLRETQPDLLAMMKQASNVTVKPITDITDAHIVACNFTKEAFRSGEWDAASIHARGLFIDENSEKIVARGYEKFFHIDEEPGRSLDDWTDTVTTSYPIRFVKKFNGYLALVSSVAGKLTVFSKSGITDYSAFAEKILRSTLDNNQCEQLRGMLERTNTTAAFEVIAHNDTHPITEEGPDRLVLLDCIRNEPLFATNDSIATGIAHRFNIDTAKTIATAETPEQFMEMLDDAKSRNDEGVVVIDKNGYRSKIKADNYANRKAARGALERFWHGKAPDLGPQFTELQNAAHQQGLLHAILRGAFTVTGVDGTKRFDLAGFFDALED